MCNAQSCSGATPWAGSTKCVEEGGEKGELLASRMLTAAVLIGLTRLHSVARRCEPQAFHTGGGLGVEKVQHMDPVDGRKVG